MAEQVRDILTIPQYVANFEMGLCDAEELVIDVTANLRHFCDEQGVDYGACDRRGYENYVVEAEERRAAREGR